MTVAEILEGGAGDGELIGADFELSIGHFVKELDDLADADLGDAVQRTAQLRARLEAVEVELIGRFDRSHEWSRDGYRHPTNWVRSECRLPRSVAGKRVALSRKLPTMPRTAAAFAAGDIDIAHVDRLARANSPARAPMFSIAEGALVASAREASFEEFVHDVEYFEHQVDPDPDGTEEDRDAKRRVHSSKMFNGLGKVDAVLPPVDWSIFDTTLRQIDKELFDADWAALVAEHGDAACTALLPRTTRQRRADALTEMARRASATPDGAKAPKPLAIVHIDLDTFEAELKRRAGAPFEFPDDRLCELQDGTVISPGRAVELAVEGHVRRMVFDPDGVCLEYGRRTRFFTGALREMIEARDRTCTGPGCDVPWWDCDIDHVVDWQHYGTTDGENGKLKCRWHNNHKSEYTITVDPITGRVRWRKRE